MWTRLGNGKTFFSLFPHFFIPGWIWQKALLWRIIQLAPLLIIYINYEEDI